jgi:hypothetical protein
MGCWISFECHPENLYLGASSQLSKDSPDLEIETRMSIVADCAGDKDRTEDCVHEKAACGIHWEVWRAWEKGKFVRLPQFQGAEKVNRTA